MSATIIDNDHAGFTLDNPAFWVQTSYAAGYYGTDYRRANPGGSGSHTARFDSGPVLTPGVPTFIGLTWPANGVHATNTPWKVYDSDGLTLLGSSTTGLDQSQVPADFTDGGQGYGLVGNLVGFTPSGNRLFVEVNDNANGYVVADAAWFSQTAPTVTPITVASGSYETASNWNTGVVPTDATLPGPIIRHQVTTSTNHTFGDRTNNTALTITPTGKLTCSGMVFTLQGHMVVGDDSGVTTTWTEFFKGQNNGATPFEFKFKTNSGVNPEVRTYRKVKMTITGTAAAPFLIHTDPASAGGQGRFVGLSLSGDTGSYQLGNAALSPSQLAGSIYRLGSSTLPGLSSGLSSPGAVFRMDHVYVDIATCGTTPAVAYSSTDITYSLRDSRWGNPGDVPLVGGSLAGHYYITVNNAGTPAIGSGTREVLRCLFCGPYGPLGVNNYFTNIDFFDNDMEHCAFQGAFVDTRFGVCGNSTYKENFQYVIDGQEGAGMGYDSLRNYHAGICGSALGFLLDQDHDHDQDVMQYDGPLANSSAFAPNDGGNGIFNIRRAVVICTNPSGGIAIASGFNNDANLSTVRPNHCTLIGGVPLLGAVGSWGNDGDHDSSPQIAPHVTLYSDCLIDTDAPCFLLDADSGVGSSVGWQVDIVPATACHHNAASFTPLTSAPGHFAGVPGNTDIQANTPYRAPMSGAVAPGANDLYGVNPRFKDRTVCWQNFSRLNGSTGVTDDQLLGDLLEHFWGDMATRIPAAVDYIFDGVQISNTALQFSASDGTQRGAGLFFAGGDYTLTAPSPSRGELTEASANFTLDVPSGITVTITPTVPATDPNGFFTPSSRSWSGEGGTKTFTYTPAKWHSGGHSIAVTNNAGLVNPSPVNFLALIQTGKSGTTSTNGGAAGGNIAPSMLGFPLFSGSPHYAEFARDITGDDVDDNSDYIINTWKAGNGNVAPNLHVDFSATGAGTTSNGLYGIPYDVVPGTQTLLPISYLFNVFSDAGPNVPVVPNGSFEGTAPVDTPPSSVPIGDGHQSVFVRDETTGGVADLYEFFKLYTPDAGATWNASVGRRFKIGQNIGPTDGLSGPDAAAIMMAPLVLRYEDVANGDVGHCIRATFPIGIIFGRQVWPAMCANAATADPRLLRYGGRMRIKLSWYNANVGSFSGQALVIVQAMRKYGIINTDITGGAFLGPPFIGGTTDDRWDPAALAAIAGIPIDAFEVVKQNPAYTVTGATSGLVGVQQTYNVAKVPINQQNFLGNVYLYDNGVPMPATLVQLSNVTPSGTFNWTPQTPGTHILSFNHGNQLWTDFPPIVFTATSTAPTPTRRRFGRRRAPQ